MHLPAHPSQAPAYFKIRGSSTQRLLMALGMAVWVGLLALAGDRVARHEIDTLVDAVHRSLEVQALTLRGTVARYKHIPFTSGQQIDISGLLAVARRNMPAHLSQGAKRSDRRDRAPATPVAGLSGARASSWCELWAAMGL